MTIRWVQTLPALLCTATAALLLATGCATVTPNTPARAGTNSSNANSPSANSASATSSHTANSNAASMPSAAANSNATNATGPTGSDGSTTTLSGAIQQYYAAKHEQILRIYKETDGDLVEWDFGDPTVASRYDWWNAQTEQRTDVPGNTDFTKALSISSTDVQLMTTGPNSIDAFQTFPYLIEDTRPTTNVSFQMNRVPYYLLLAHGVTFGDHKTCVMTSLFPTADGFQAEFGPLPGKESLFYAASTGCPTMKTSYDKKTHMFTIRFLNTKLPPSVEPSAAKLTDPLIASTTVHQDGADTVLQLTLQHDTTHYMAKQSRLFTQSDLPYVSFHFAQTVEFMYPAVEEQP